MNDEPLGLLPPIADLLDFFRRVSALPTSEEEFVSTYDAFSNPLATRIFASALRDARALARRFAGPEGLPGAADGEPGPAMHEALRSVVQHVTSAAEALERLRDELPHTLAPARGSLAQRAASLRQLLRAPGGALSETRYVHERSLALCAEAKAMSDEICSLGQKLGAHEATLVNDANQSIGYHGRAIERLAPEARYAARKLEEAGLFSFRARRKARAERLGAELAASRDVLARKERFTKDLKGLSPSLARAMVAPARIVAQLDLVARRHGFIARRLDHMCDAASDGQLGNYLWVVRALDPDALATEWSDVRRRALAFLGEPA